jgi:cellobiose phosphorylase
MSSQYGYFDDSKKEYVITRPDTPLPWLNYLGQDDFFGLMTNCAGGYTFYRDAKMRRLTRYRYNEIPYDNNGRYLYIKDGDSIWSPSWKPVRTELDRYSCRHGLGYSTLLAEKDGVEVEVTFFIPNNETVELWQTRVTNRSGQHKDLKLFSFIEFCLYDALNDATNYQRTFSIGEVEVEDGVIYHTTEYRERRDHYTIFACSREVDGFDTSRDAFVGVHNGLNDPQVVLEGEARNSMAHGWNPIGSHQLNLSLEDGETTAFTFMLGYVVEGSAEKFAAPFVVRKEKARSLVAKYSDMEKVNSALEAVRSRWTELLSNFQVETPNEAFNRMGNVWNQVQCMATFNLSRSASLFESGIGRGMGFRDSNQDLLGFVHLVPEKARQRLLDIAATQMSSGLCYHQYQPLTKKGNSDIGGGFMDDHLWMILSTCAYVKETGDRTVLDENIGFADQADDSKSGTLLEHLELSLQYCMKNRGPHGLPLIGHADWNDCLNLNCFSTEPNESFQLAGHGTDDQVAESLMIAGLFCYAADELRELYGFLEDAAKAEWSQSLYAEMSAAIDQHGWDGDWYLRAYDAFGQPVGTASDDEGRIYIESQGWCILGGNGIENGRARRALDSVHQHLNTDSGCVLQDPPYTKYHTNLGEVSSYPPGYKENGGVFCHNNPWIHLALMKLGMADRALDYYLSICPAAKEDQIETYRGEPYVYSQMIAGKAAATPGEAKNSWLTGTAAWTFLTVSQGFCGIQPDYNGLRIDPCLPSSWPKISVKRRFRGATYEIEILNEAQRNKGVREIFTDGKKIEGDVLPLAEEGTTLKVKVVL